MKHRRDMLKLTNSFFSLGINVESGGICSLKFPDDPFETDFMMTEDTDYIDVNKLFQPLGSIHLRYCFGGGSWKTFNTAGNGNNPQVTSEKNKMSLVYSLPLKRDANKSAFQIREIFYLKDNALIWDLQFHNTSGEVVEIGDLELPLHFNTAYVQDTRITYTRRLIKHAFISGNSSFIYWMRPNGVGPFLVMTPIGNTQLEYFKLTHNNDSGRWEGLYSAFIHSNYPDSAGHRNEWRLQRSGVNLFPKGENHSEVAYGFKFQWAEDYQAVRDILYREGLLDVRVLPGMTIPNDLSVKFSIRTQNTINRIISEYPEQTRVEYIGETEKHLHIYQVYFSRLGENLLTIQYDNGKQCYLEFLVTEPLETLIKKRASFLVNHQLHRKPDKWYDGLFSVWDMRQQVLRSPDDLDGLASYVVSGGDDCFKAPFLAIKNMAYPDQNEIKAIEYYIEHFVWGKHQRTDREHPHPYGIYGTPNWFENRKSATGFESGGNGQEHLWRTYDYPHLIVLYYQMFRIARKYPQMTRYLDAKGYLERAYGTAMAFFEVPYNIKMGEPFFLKGWSDWAYKLGNMDERYIPDLISTLAEEGWIEKGDRLRSEWEKKVKYFLYDHPYPFGSEMFFDSTAFESTHTIAKYALKNELTPDDQLWYDKNYGKWYSHPQIKPEVAHEFMNKQIAGNIACRGWLETAYYLLGSDIRACGSSQYTLSYMSQLGGWAILDYAINHAKDPAEYLRLGYASVLSSWALMNTGTPESNYGYWFPGKTNDGAAGWAFEPRSHGKTWGVGEIERGIWHYDGEIDLGFGGGLTAAATIVTDDPIFGFFAFGGELTETEDRIFAIPRDGIRQQFHVLSDVFRFHLRLSCDGFTKDSPIIYKKDLSELAFSIENRGGGSHSLQLSLSGLPAGTFQVTLDDTPFTIFKSNEAQDTVILLGMSKDLNLQILVKRNA